MMNQKLALLQILLLLPILAWCQSQLAPPKRADTTIRGCAFIAQSCKFRCATEQQSFVRWRIDGITANVTCQLLNPAVENVPPISGRTAVTVTIFDAPCCQRQNCSDGSNSTCLPCPGIPIPDNSTNCNNCPKTECPTAKECPVVSPGLDDERLHTLLILGVTTLTSILLMCLFIFLGLVFYRKKNRAYTMDGQNEENHSLSKEKKAPSTTLTISGMCCMRGSDCSQDNTPSTSTSSHNLPPNYVKTTNNKLNNRAEYENTDQVGRSGPDLNRLSMQEYVNQEDLKNLMPSANFPRSIKVKKDNFEMGEVGAANGPVPPSNNKPSAVSGEFEIRGGFIQPKRTSTKSEGQNPKVGEAEESPGDLSLSDDIALHFESTQMSLFPELADPDENPYVEAPPTPPIKSPRNQTQFDPPDAYQTIMPSNPNHTTDSNEYNLLLHNTSVANTDKKALLFMNNNSHQQAVGKNNHKTEVTLKPSTNIKNASEA